MKQFDLLGGTDGSLIAITRDGGEQLSRMLRGTDRPDRTILIDPIDMSPITKKTTQVDQHLKSALSTESTDADLRYYSFFGLTSFQPSAEELKIIFPGLKEIRSRPIRLTGPSELMQLVTDLPSPVRVMIDAPGSELECLKVLDEAGLLSRSDLLQFRCGTDVFFTDSSDQKSTVNWLVEKSFRVLWTDTSDPDWPITTLTYEPLASRVTSLETENIEVKANYKELKEELRAARHSQAASQEGLERSRMDFEGLRKDNGILLEELQRGRFEIEDLVKRNRKISEEKTRLENLIRQLTPRLQEASEHLRQISLPTKEISPNTSKKSRLKSKGSK